MSKRSGKYVFLSSAADKVFSGSTPGKDKDEKEEIKLDASEEIGKKYENILISAQGGQSDTHKKINAFLGKLNQKYDAYLDRLTGESYKDTDYYNGIVSEYEALGKKMAYDAAASSAAANAGNIDSLASANAHRQVISYKNAGERAARDAYSEEMDRYTKGLGNYASDMVDAYDLLSDSEQKNNSFTLSLANAYRDHAKLQAQSGKNAEKSADRSDELDKSNITNRYLSYAKMLSEIYPDYAREIEELFFSV